MLEREVRPFTWQTYCLHTIKHLEIPELRRHKGRICYRGDDTRDEYGAAAIHQDLSSSPTSLQGANANICYGAAPENGTSTADAVRAYVQALLKSLYETWVAIRFELWPKGGSWQGYKRCASSQHIMTPRKPS